MTFEPTRPGNPNQLAIQQHVFPRSAIERFADSSGKVQVQSLRALRPRVRVPTSHIFCGQRVWDQATETYKTRREETAYRLLADAIVAGDVRSLDTKQDETVSWFMALWNARHLARMGPTGDVTMRGVSADPLLTREQEENLESNGMIFARGNVMPSRFLTGVHLRHRMDHEFSLLHGKHWGIVRSIDSEFVVPDNALRHRWVPISPNVGLALGLNDLTFDTVEVGFANHAAVTRAHEYFFARDLEKCPILLRTLPEEAHASWLSVPRARGTFLSFQTTD